LEWFRKTGRDFRWSQESSGYDEIVVELGAKRLTRGLDPDRWDRYRRMQLFRPEIRAILDRERSDPAWKNPLRVWVPPDPRGAKHGDLHLDAAWADPAEELLARMRHYGFQVELNSAGGLALHRPPYRQGRWSEGWNREIDLQAEQLGCRLEELAVEVKALLGASVEGGGQ
jgi:hypothetical protein